MIYLNLTNYIKYDSKAFKIPTGTVEIHFVNGRNNGNFYMAPEAKVAFAIRIKGVNHIRPQVKKILRL